MLQILCLLVNPEHYQCRKAQTPTRAQWRQAVTSSYPEIAISACRLSATKVQYSAEPLLELKRWLTFYERFGENRMAVLKKFVETDERDV